MAQPCSNAMDQAHKLATDTIASAIRALGVDGAISQLKPDFGSQGTLLLYRLRKRDGDETSEPEYIPVMNESPWIADSDLEMIRRNVARHVRRHLRNRAIVTAGEEKEPQWSFTMHRLARAMLLEAGIDPALFIDWRETLRMRAISHLGEEAGMSIGQFTVEDGRIDMHSLRWRGLELGGRGKPFVIVDQPIPETLAHALVGRPLSEAISHPAVQRARPIRIERVDTNSEFTTFIIEDVQDFLRQPPVGTDRRWRRIPFMPQTTD